MPAKSRLESERPLRITIVQGPLFPVPPLKSGGTERLMEILGQLWAASGNQVTHISRQFDALPLSETKDGVEHIRVKSRDAPKGKLTFRLAELIYCWRVLRVLPPADVVVINSALFPFLYRKKDRGLPVVWLGRAPKRQFRFLRRLPLIQTISQDMVARVLKEAPWMAGRVSNVGAPLVPSFCTARCRKCAEYDA